MLLAWAQRLATLQLIMLVMGFNCLAQIQGDYIAEIRGPASDELDEGWNPLMDLKVSGTLNSNQRVIGQPEGTTLTFGLSLNNSFIYLAAPHEWRQSLNITESVTKSADRSFYIRNADELKYESLYLYRVKASQLAPFVRFAADTSIFKGIYQSDEIQTFSIERRDGSVTQVQSTSLRLTDPWHPLTLKESVGALYTFVSGKKSNLEARLGLGAQQVLAKNQLVLDDRSGTSEIEVREVDSYHQAGLEAALSGRIPLNETTSLSFSAEALIPYANSRDKALEDKSPYQLINTDFRVNISSKLNNSISLDFEVSAKSQPQILNAYQIQQNVLLSFSQSLL